MHYLMVKLKLEEFPFKFKIKQRASSIEIFYRHLNICYILEEALLRNFHHPIRFKAARYMK